VEDVDATKVSLFIRKLMTYELGRNMWNKIMMFYLKET
jgi:hypothetical protein